MFLSITYFAKAKLEFLSVFLIKYLFFLLFNKLFKLRTKNTTFICNHNDIIIIVTSLCVL